MNRNRVAAAVAAALLVLSTHPLGADVRADQKTRVELAGMLGRVVNIFGGRAAREGVTSSVAVKGDRKATTSGDTAQIVDLAEEKIYDIDLKKKSYTAMTFADVRRRMEEAQKKAAEDARKAGNKESPPAPAGNNDKPVEVDVDVDVMNTGATKAINGFTTHQSILTITLREKGKTIEEGGGLITTTDVWLAPKIAAMKEITDFDVRYAKMLFGGLAGASAEQMAAVMAMYPMMKQAVGRMSTETAKLEGTPILTTVTVDAVKSAAQMAEQAKPAPEAAPTGGLGGLLGGLAKKAAGRKGGDDNSPRTTFMTTTTEVLKVAADVTAADVAIPAGFKENK